MQATNAEQFAAQERGELPGVVAIRDGIWSVALPLPIRSPPFVLSYLIEGSAGDVHIIDSGWDSDESWNTLVAGLTTTGHTVDDIATVTVTHRHHDHLGMADRIRAASGARVILHAAEQAAIDSPNNAVDFAGWGVPAEVAATLEAARAAHQPMTFTADGVVEHGDALAIAGREVRVIHTPGHTPGHIALSMPAEGLLFTGDLLLPRIFPGLGLGGDTPNPMADYLQSLDRVEALGDPEVCPGHGYHFHGVGQRCEETRRHQLGRTDEVERILAVDPHASVWEVASRVTWTDTWAGLHGFMLASALAQTNMRMAFLRGPV